MENKYWWADDRVYSLIETNAIPVLLTTRRLLLLLAKCWMWDALGVINLLS